MLREDIQLQTVQLVRLVPEVGGIAVTPRERLRRRIIDRLPFVGLVVLPTLLAIVYSLVLAAPRYQSDVTYVVRTPGSAASSEIASVVQGSGIVKSSDDIYVAKEYIESRDAMQQLIEKDGLLAMFAGAGWDPLWRYPLFWKTTQEGLEKHYAKFVTVEASVGSGISKLSMQAFTPEDAQRLANALIDHTEQFLNGLNGRAQKDAVDLAITDVERAKQTAYKALDAVTAFRNAEETVDPTKSSSGIVAGISSLSLEVASSNARLAELMTTAPQSPEIPTLRTRVTALQEQIGKQRQQLGGDATSLAPRIERYQRLLLEQQFAEKAFVSALTSLEAARLDASRQRIFVERITNADLPDLPAYPLRKTTIFAVFGFGLLLWWIAHQLGRDAREHGRK